MDLQSGRHLRFDRVQELAEFQRAMTAMQLADDLVCTTRLDLANKISKQRLQWPEPPDPKFYPKPVAVNPRRSASEFCRSSICRSEAAGCCILQVDLQLLERSVQGLTEGSRVELVLQSFVESFADAVGDRRLLHLKVTLRRDVSG
jgi:hypothetical protein